MKKLKLIAIAALAVCSVTSFASDVTFGPTEAAYSKTAIDGSAVKQEYLEVSQGLKAYGMPLVVSVQGGRVDHKDVSGLSLATGTTFDLAKNGWKLDIEGQLSLGSVRTVGSALWLAGSNFDLTKSTTVLDVAATSHFPLARERSFSLDLDTSLAAGQGLATFTTDYHPTTFKNGLTLTSRSSLGTLKLNAAYAQFNGQGVAVDYAKEFTVGFSKRNWGVDVGYIVADNGVNNTKIAAHYKF